MEKIHFDDKNYRIHPDINKNLIKKSVNELGAGRSILVDKTGKIIAGNGVYEQWGNRPVKIIETNGEELVVVKRNDLDPDDPKRQKLAFADNHTSDLSEFNTQLLLQDFDLLNLDQWNIDFSEEEEFTGPVKSERVKSLQERFIIPPFSVLDSRQGYWQDRKKSWHSIGINSQETRENVELVAKSGQGSHIYELRNAMREKLGYDPTWDEILAEAEKRGYYIYSGASVFDPVLTELSYRWFCPEEGTVLDPFAGGSVRGIVAGILGYNYTGIDLRIEQVEANRRQAANLKEHLKKTPEWKTGNSLNIPELVENQFDFVFSCPPYHDLEHYSEDPEDLSNMDYENFLDVYRQIILRSAEKLKENRFTCFVVSEIREKTNGGFYKNFISETISAFESAGVRFYNEIVLLNVAGSVPVRVTRQFNSSRKVGRIHQNVLVFFKGDPTTIRNNFKELDFSESETLI